MFIDSHCHLDRLDLTDFNDDLSFVVNAASAVSVNEMLCVSVTLQEFPKMAELTKPFPNVYLSCGTHPLNQEDKVDQGQLHVLAQHPRVIAIGETGLDYFYAPETKALQQDSFRKHIRVARELNKPLIIHTRDAQEDTLAILQEERADQIGEFCIALQSHSKWLKLQWI